MQPSIWIVGASRSGKTGRLVQRFGEWALSEQSASSGAVEASVPSTPPALAFAAIGDNRLDLSDRLAAEQDRYPVETATPLGFFFAEVVLFYPLLVERGLVGTQFPLRLRPETEQALATRLWQPALEDGTLMLPGVSDYFLVRRMLDLLQLASLAEVPPEDIAPLLQQGLTPPETQPDLWLRVGEAIAQWRDWCLERGLLTYGIAADLYSRYLLPDATYQARLRDRFSVLLADDVDDYPAIAYTLFSHLLDIGLPGIFTYNPQGAVRWGLGADPARLGALAARCQVEMLDLPAHTLGTDWADPLAGWVREPVLLPDLPDAMPSIQTISRAQLLRETAEQVAQAIHSGQVRPDEVAIIGPGLDAIARYTLREILNRRGIAVEALNDQQPLAASPLIRALLTLLALVYPGLGRLISREAIAELLIVLSQPPTPNPSTAESSPTIDPVRAGLLVDHCFVPDPDRPYLLPATAFPRWDRLGHRATQSYESMRQWIETQQAQQQQRLIPSPATLLDRAIQQFLYGGSMLPYDRLAALRELMETAQHFWEVEARLRQADPLRSTAPLSESVQDFIELLRGGTITADPYPVRPLITRPAVTLATIFQYRANRGAHRWQFWLDAGSPLWLTGGGGLFGAPLFLSDWSGQLWTAADALEADRNRLERQIRDLLYRADERVYLCHSDLSTSGQEQTGPLLTLVNAARAIAPENSVALGL
ncbi:MAG: recombinase family protein [Cyanobacteria bacterium J069]|nr:MAG: recombinase family protein [Cyanobacteria bacterium J069]